MFEAIIDQLKQQAADALMRDNGMDQPEAERTAEAAGKTFVGIAKERIRQNDYSILDEALSGTTTDSTNPVTQSLIAPLANALSEKMGIDSAKATAVASTLVPLAFNLFNTQVAHAKASGVDVNAMVRQLLSGGLSLANMGSAMTLAKQFMKGQPGKTGGMFSKFF